MSIFSRLSKYRVRKVEAYIAGKYGARAKAEREPLRRSGARKPIKGTHVLPRKHKDDPERLVYVATNLQDNRYTYNRWATEKRSRSRKRIFTGKRFRWNRARARED